MASSLLPPFNATTAYPNDDGLHDLGFYQSVLPQAAYFVGYDEVLFENILIIVYQTPKEDLLSSICITKFGTIQHDNLVLDSRSRFWPSCENLLPQHRSSSVRRALAISLLKNYNQIINGPMFNELVLPRAWDETTAGYLASTMKLTVGKTPEQLGNKISQYGFLQPHSFQSVLIDVVYSNSADEDNNRLVFLLGHQLDQLFDPMREYSPEKIEVQFPEHIRPPQLQGSETIDSIVTDLLGVQMEYTTGIVDLLQKFIIPVRLFVLKAAPGGGINKINQVFPPTIDEITRLNCILYENLQKAAQFGYVEVFRILACIIPFFYRAFIRHEANLKHFDSRIKKFYEKNEQKIFENPEINEAKFSLEHISTVIRGSLTELNNIKLITRRLHDTVSIEKLKRSNFSLDVTDEESDVIEDYYKTCMNVIDMYGTREESTGKSASMEKLLLNNVSNWPQQLKEGWQTRKLVGVFDVQDVKTEGSLVMVVFSDYLMLLAYEDADGDFNQLSMSDVLLHSLVNHMPLPPLTSFSTLKVSAWCDINEIMVTAYLISGSQFVKLINCTNGGFKGSSRAIYTTNLLVEDSTRVMELVSKAKVLNKSQPFHLFKSDDALFHLFSTAHEQSAYVQETNKSLFVVYLNISGEHIPPILEANPHVFVAVTVSLINNELVRIVARNRTGSFYMDQVLSPQELTGYLKQIVIANHRYLFSGESVITDALFHGYRADLEFFAQTYETEDTDTETGPRLSVSKRQDKVSWKGVDDSTTKKPSLFKRIYCGLKRKSRKLSNGSRSSSVSTETSAKSLKKARNTSTTSGTNHASRIASSVYSLSKAPSRKASGRDVSNSTIPKGEEKRFSHIYMPSPDLERKNSSRKPSRRTSLDFKFKFPMPMSAHDVEQMKNADQIETNNVRVQQDADSEPLQVEPRAESQAEPQAETEQPPIAEVTMEKVQSTQPVTQQPAQAPTQPSSQQADESVPPRSPWSKPAIIRVVKPKLKDIKPKQPEQKKELIMSHIWSKSDATRVASGDSIVHRPGKSEVFPPTIPKSLTRESFQECYDDFYEDGQSNWVTVMSRENSSNLESEVRALKEVANMDSEQILDLRSYTNNVNNSDLHEESANLSHYTDSQNSRNVSASSNITQQMSSESQHSSRATSRTSSGKEPIGLGYKYMNGPEMSTRSLASVNSTQFLSEFNKKLENVFGYDLKVFNFNWSSEEEYFSSDEKHSPLDFTIKEVDEVEV